MDKPFKIFICLVLLLLFKLQLCYSLTFNHADSIAKLNNIQNDSVYISLANSIVTDYLNDAKLADAKALIANQIKHKKPFSELWQQAVFLQCKLYYQLKMYDTAIKNIDSLLVYKHKYLPAIVAKLHRIKAQCFFRTQNFTDALMSYRSALAILEILKDYQQIDDVLSALSSCYFEIDDLPLALKYAQQAETISERNNDLQSRSRILNTMGNINKELKNYSQAKVNFSQCLEIASNNGDYEGVILSTSGIAMIERNMGNYKDAWLLLEKALACAKQHNANHFITGVKINMANIKSDQGILNEAEVIYKEALLVAKQISDRKNMALINANLGFLYFDEARYIEAERFLKTAMPIATEIGDVNLIKEIHGGLYDAYKAMNKSHEALYEHEQYALYADSLMNDDKAKQISNLRTQYAVNQKEKELNDVAQRQRIISEAAIGRQKLIRNFSIASGFLCLLLAGFVFQRYRDKLHTSKILAEKNAAIEYAYHDLKLAQKSLIETEKQREAQSVRVTIARDIHDEIGSGLTKITLLSDVAKRKTQQPEIADSLSKITSYSKNVSTSLSEIVWSINPMHDNVASLISYMKATANNLLEDSGINYTLEFPHCDTAYKMHPELKRNIYLVMKEAIHNTIKYAHAKNISIAFSVNNDNFILKIIDDGVGMKNINNSSGNGLVNMHQRMLQHSNMLQIFSEPDKGCTIVASGKII